ncbi:hypothetical protein BGX21_008625 [Mortierella sp. AD011]|nr:hypothetical protein BGX21_008625 [Mortierella sp. AD011]
MAHNDWTLWDIPELKAHLAQFLDDAQLAVASAVCKSWNTTFIPILYSQIIWNESSVDRKPSKKAIQTHATHIRTLDILGSVTEFPFGDSINIKDLYVGYGSIDHRIWDQLLKLIYNNPGLRSVNIDLLTDQHIYHHEIMEALCHSKNLRTLSITLETLDVDMAEHLFNACSRLEDLTLDIQKFTGIESVDKWTVFPNIRILSLTVEDGLSSRQQLQIIRKCPQLRSLLLDRNPLLSGSMTQEIMTSCPLLDALSVVSLKANDVLGVVQEESGVINIEGLTLRHPQDWICLNLTSLTVYICGLEGKPSEWQRSVLKQLARLEKLELLDIGPDVSWGEMVQDGLDLRLASGLDILVTLKRLETIMFLRLRQQMEEQDVMWMIQAWPRLRNIHGKLHYNNSRNKWLKAILRKRHISTIEDDVYDDE